MGGKSVRVPGERRFGRGEVRRARRSAAANRQKERREAIVLARLGGRRGVDRAQTEVSATGEQGLRPPLHEEKRPLRNVDATGGRRPLRSRLVSCLAYRGHRRR